MEKIRRFITLEKAIKLEDLIAWLSNLLPKDYDMYVVDNEKDMNELEHETNLLNELATINKRRNEILNELEKSYKTFSNSTMINNTEVILESDTPYEIKN